MTIQLIKYLSSNKEIGSNPKFLTVQQIKNKNWYFEFLGLMIKNYYHNKKDNLNPIISIEKVSKFKLLEFT